MKNITFFLLLFAFGKTTTLDAQHNFEWAFNFGSRSHDEVVDMIADDYGNIYTIGRFAGRVDFDPGIDSTHLNITGLEDIFIAKYTAQKKLVWAKNLGNTRYAVANSLTIDHANHVYITGRFSNTLDFDPGPNTNTLTALGNYDAFILKLDTSGSFVWAKQFGGGTDGGSGLDIQVDQQGNVYTTGRFRGTLDFDPNAGVYNLSPLAGSTDNVFISKLDAAGNFIWAKSLGSTFYIGASTIHLDRFNNLYLTGGFEGNADLDPGVGVSMLSAPFLTPSPYLLKLDAAGQFQWVKQITSNGGGGGIGLATDAQGNIYTTGIFSDTTDFDPNSGTFNLVGAGIADVYVAKYTPSGTLTWAIRFGNNNREWVSDIHLDSYNNVYTTGTFEGLVDFDPGFGFYPKSASNSKDVFVSKLSDAGHLIWAGRMGGPSDDESYCITSDRVGNVYVGGSFRDSADFDPGAGVYTLYKTGNSSGSLDAFIVKLFDVAVSIPENREVEKPLQFYPNPVNNELTIVAGFSASKVIELFSSQGKLLERKSLQSGKNNIDFSNLTSGVYFLKMDNQIYKVMKPR